MLFKKIIILWIIFILFCLLVLDPLGFRLVFHNYQYGDNSILTSLWLGGFIFLLQMYLLYIVTFTKEHKGKGLRYSVYALLLGIFGHILFLVFNFNYTYNKIPDTFFISKENTIYINDIYSYKKNINHYRNTGKTYILKTVEDHIELLKYTVATGDEIMYKRTVESAYINDLNKILKLYNNKAFEYYIFKIASEGIDDYPKYRLNDRRLDHPNKEYHLEKGSPFEKAVRWMSEESQYDDIKEMANLVINAVDYYEVNINNIELKNKYSEEYNMDMGWWGYFNHISYELNLLTKNIYGLEHSWYDYNYDYDEYLNFKNKYK